MQFGKVQELSPEHVSTSSDLHKLDRRKNKSITDWQNDKASHKDINQERCIMTAAETTRHGCRKLLGFISSPTGQTLIAWKRDPTSQMSLMKRSGWTSVSTMAPCETVWPVSLYEVSQKLKRR